MPKATYTRGRSNRFGRWRRVCTTATPSPTLPTGSPAHSPPRPSIDADSGRSARRPISHHRRSPVGLGAGRSPPCSVVPADRRSCFSRRHTVIGGPPFSDRSRSVRRSPIRKPPSKARSGQCDGLPHPQTPHKAFIWTASTNARRPYPMRMRCRSRVIRVKSGRALDAMLVDDERATQTRTKHGRRDADNTQQQ